VARGRAADKPLALTQQIELTGPLDRREVELLLLEIRRLARARGMTVREVRVEEISTV
jgi:hypothetical protein